MAKKDHQRYVVSFSKQFSYPGFVIDKEEEQKSIRELVEKDWGEELKKCDGDIVATMKMSVEVNPYHSFPALGEQDLKVDAKHISIDQLSSILAEMAYEKEIGKSLALHISPDLYEEEMVSEGETYEDDDGNLVDSDPEYDYILKEEHSRRLDELRKTYFHCLVGYLDPMGKQRRQQESEIQF